VLIFGIYHYIFNWIDILDAGKKSQIIDVKFKMSFSKFFALKNIPNLPREPTIFGV